VRRPADGVIHLDTSVLIDALTGTRRSMPAPRQVGADIGRFPERPRGAARTRPAA